MADNESTYNFDDGFTEYFEFILFKHKYRFRYLTSEEFDNLLKEKPQSELDGLKRFYSLITSVDDAPPFEEAVKKMAIKQLKAFRTMINKEFGPDEGN